MNICLVSTGFPPEEGGGIGTYIYNLSRGLAELGHSVSVITRTERDTYDFCREGEVDVYRMPEKQLPLVEPWIPGVMWSWQVYKLISKLNKENKIDIIEFPNWEAPGVITQLSGLKIPVVVRIHTPYFETLELDKEEAVLGFGDKVICGLEKYSVLKSDQVVSSTIFHAGMLASKYDMDKGKIKILPLGIEQKNLQDMLEEGRGKSGFNVLYVSRLEHRKGTLTLIDALPGILRDRKDINIDFVGKDRKHAPGGIYHEEYFVNNYPEYQNQVRFHGYVSDEELDAFYRNADLFVVPSVYESFGLIYVEAMMHGLPVIATRGGGIPEVVIDGEDGFLIRENDVEGLVEAFDRLYNDEELRKNMGKKARKRYLECYNQEVMSKNTESLYKKVVNMHESRG